MPRPALEVADIFRDHGAAWREADCGHVSLGQLQVMSAIEACRTAALGGHVARCEDCAHTTIAYNSCRNRHCPKCQGAAARDWMADREAELLPVPYFHVVFTLPSAIGDIAYTNKAVIYDLPYDRGGPKTSRRQHRHHRRAPYLGLGHDPPSACAHDRSGRRALGRRPALDRRQADLLPAGVRALQTVQAAHAGEARRRAPAGKLKFYGTHAHLADAKVFATFLAPLSKTRWFVYAKRPFAGPKAVLAYLARYTHRIAISNSRMIKTDCNSVTFKVKNYRVEGHARYTTMTLDVAEFIRRFLIHVLPKGFHRIRHYGFLASATKAANLATARQRLNASAPDATTGDTAAADADTPTRHCPSCGGRMHVIETFARGQTPHHQPAPRPTVIRIDTS